MQDQSTSAPGSLVAARGNPFATAKPWRVPSVLVGTSAGPSRKAKRSSSSDDRGPLSAEEFVAHLEARGSRVVRLPNGWLAQCPAHDDRDPSLHIRPGHTHPVWFQCYASCSKDQVLAQAGLVWADVLSRGALYQKPFRSRAPSKAIRVVSCYVCSRRLSTTTTSLSLTVGEVSGIGGVLGIRGDVFEDEAPPDIFSSDDGALVEAPRRAGKVMRTVLFDLIGLANERFDNGDTFPIAYGRHDAASRLGLDPGLIGQALRRFEAHGTIECVGQLPPPRLGLEDGAKLYALRVVVPCPVCTGDVEAAPVVAGLDGHDAAAPHDPALISEPLRELEQEPGVLLAELDDFVVPSFTAAGGSAFPLHVSERYAGVRR